MQPISVGVSSEAAPAPTVALTAAEKKRGIERFSISRLLLVWGGRQANFDVSVMMHMQHNFNMAGASAADDFVLDCIQTCAGRRFVTFQPPRKTNRIPNGLILDCKHGA